MVRESPLFISEVSGQVRQAGEIDLGPVAVVVDVFVAVEIDRLLRAGIAAVVEIEQVVVVSGEGDFGLDAGHHARADGTAGTDDDIIRAGHAAVDIERAAGGGGGDLEIIDARAGGDIGSGS